MLTLIADSGSTKTDWVLINRNEVLSNLKTIGFNPYFQTKDQIAKEIKNTLVPDLKDFSKIDQVYYYGAGCSNEVNCNLVREGIIEGLNIKTIHVHHDLLAAARALCGREAGIACILGTGSNSCLFDGETVKENVPSVGYLFGDNGSGANIGKTFIQAYFDDALPPKLKAAFEEAGYHREQILDNVYKNGMPSRYLASISKFVQLYIKDSYIKKLVKGCFTEFFHKQVDKYTNSRQYKVHSVGSIGFYYKPLLAEVANEEGYTLGKVIKSPIEGLIDYHQSLL
jgi:N-acetylglucosamine kinase-like BadF-type ATPase